MELKGINGFNPFGSKGYSFCEYTTQNSVVNKEHLLSLGIEEEITGFSIFGMPCFRPLDTILSFGFDAVELLYHNDKNNLQSVLGVRKGKTCGLINMMGVQIFPLEFSSIICPINSSSPVFCVNRYSDHKWAAISIFGDIIVPFGSYYYMWGFDHDHCLVSTKPGQFKGRAIIGINGEVLISPERYIDIYGFRGKDTIKVEDMTHKTSYLSVETLKEVSNLMVSEQHKRDKFVDIQQSYGSDYPYDEPGWNSYDEYGGYNGYDDFTIDSAFDGDPEATWNID